MIFTAKSMACLGLIKMGKNNRKMMRFKLHSHDFCIWYPFYNLYDGKDPSPELPCLRGCELFFDNFDHFWHSWRGPELLQCRVVKVKLLQSHGFGYAMKGKDLIELKIQSTGSLGLRPLRWILLSTWPTFSINISHLIWISNRLQEKPF